MDNAAYQMGNSGDEKDHTTQNGTEKMPPDSKTSTTPKIVEFEDIIEHLGSFGHWQRVLFVLISLPDIWGSFAMLLPVFIGATPRWRCETFAGPESNNSLNSIVNDSLTTGGNWKACPNVDGDECEIFAYHDNFTSIVSEWDLICEKDFVSDLISSIQMGGLILGAGIFGQFSDLMGRKKSYFLTIFILLTSGFISAFANSWQLYAACRAFVGVGFGSYMVINCVYPLEFVGRRWRLLCGTIGFWAIGQLLLALMAYLIRDWRHLAMAASISGIPYFLLWWVIPESPRWLIQKHRFQEAEVILATIAARNKKPPPDISELKRFAQQDEEKTRLQRKYTYLDLFRQWRYARLTLITMLAWFTTFLMYYQVTYNIKNLSGDRYLNVFFSGLVDLIGMLSVIAVLNWLGRKKSFIGYELISLASLLTILIIIALGKDAVLGLAVTSIAMVGKLSSLSGTYICQIYSAEVFPTDIRNVGVGIGAIAGRIGGVIAPQLVYLGTINTVAPYVIIMVLAVVLLPLILLLPETNGQPLEDAYIEKQNPASPPDDEAEIFTTYNIRL